MSYFNHIGILALFALLMNSNLGAVTLNVSDQLDLIGSNAADYLTIDKATKTKLDALVKTFRQGLNAALSDISFPEFCKLTHDILYSKYEDSLTYPAFLDSKANTRAA